MSVLRELYDCAERRAAALAPDPQARCRRRSFAEALRGRDRIAVIAEFKRRSPSRSAIAPDREVGPQVVAYRQAGAAAISVLTEPSRFGGGPEDLQDAAAAVDLPLLRKDFVVSPAQVQESARLGASAVLLILRGLAPGHLDELVAAAVECGLDPLVECHTEAEVERALAFEQGIVGINNRDLDSLAIDLLTARRLLPLVPEDRIAVAESGYEEPAQIEPLRGLCDAVLVGTSLMRSPDPRAFVRAVSG